MSSKKNSACRYCRSKALHQFLSLGEHPPSNSFIRPEEIPQERRYPLEVYFCENCFLVQLVDVVPAEIIFDDYLYLSSSSKVLLTHYAQLVIQASSRFGLKAKDTVVDIGCNDGVLLKGYKTPGVHLVGVEPSKVAEVASQAGFSILKEFFGPSTADRIMQKFGQAKIITATNVFVHVDDMVHFVNGFQRLLADDGVIIIEASYLLDVIDQVLFDTIYHEHLCYLSLTPLIPFLQKFDLEVFDVQNIAVGASGPALRVSIQKKNGPYHKEEAVDALLRHEKEWGVGKLARYQDYASKVAEIKKALSRLIEEKQAQGASVAAYGAPAKGNTLLNYFELDKNIIPYVADTNPLKQGMVTPGTHIPIVSEEEFLRHQPDYALLLSWNYLDFFLTHSEYIRRGGRFIVPLPSPIIKP